MLTLELDGSERYDESENRFIEVGGRSMDFEHSLVSLSKWESRWHKPFLRRSDLDEPMTSEESIDYVKCMSLSDDDVDGFVSAMTKEQFDRVSDYIDDSMTATWFADRGGVIGSNRQVITAEIVYYWMIALEIPFECQYWHLNRLLTLIRVCNEKNAPNKKMSKAEAYNMQKKLNAQRRMAHNTTG